MNPIRQWLIERWLKSRGWYINGYPFERGDLRCQYLVYSHPDIKSVGGIEWAIDEENKRAAQRSRLKRTVRLLTYVGDKTRKTVKSYTVSKVE